MGIQLQECSAAFGKRGAAVTEISEPTPRKRWTALENFQRSIVSFLTIGTLIAVPNVVLNFFRQEQEAECLGEPFLRRISKMLTATCEPIVSETTPSAQNETPSDFEISRRVLRIRSGWSVGERVRRRRAAEQRFADLMDKLVGIEAA
jgi:hypothetical protein